LSAKERQDISKVQMGTQGRGRNVY